MLTYILSEVNGDEYIFYYYPDGNKDSPGKVGLSKNGEKRVIQESEQDFGKRYANHAMNGIDISQESGTVAWYQDVFPEVIYESQK